MNIKQMIDRAHGPNSEKTLEDFGKGAIVNVKAHPLNDEFNDFTGHVVGHRGKYVLVEDDEHEEGIWECRPEQLSHCSDEYVHKSREERTK